MASLTIYDMLKPIDESLSIESVKLIEKEGGTKNLLQSHASGQFKASWYLLLVTRGDTRMINQGRL